MGRKYTIPMISKPHATTDVLYSIFMGRWLAQQFNERRRQIFSFYIQSHSLIPKHVPLFSAFTCSIMRRTYKVVKQNIFIITQFTTVGDTKRYLHDIRKQRQSNIGVEVRLLSSMTSHVSPMYITWRRDQFFEEHHTLSIIRITRYVPSIFLGDEMDSSSLKGVSR